jgi:ABC-type multidrug transport system ATPase subunit
VCFAPDRPWLAPALTPGEHFRLADPSSEWTALADQLELTAWLETRVCALSGGQLRLTEVAVALACRPGALVLDEPFRGLAPLLRDRIGRALRAAAARGIAVLYADHDARLVQETADRLFSIEQGMTRPVPDFRDRPVNEWYHAWPH